MKKLIKTLVIVAVCFAFTGCCRKMVSVDGVYGAQHKCCDEVPWHEECKE